MPLRDFAQRYPSLVARLCQAKQGGRVAHGYLVVGDHRETLDGFVTAWLQVNVCSNPATDGDACGECVRCRQVAEGTYPTMMRVRPLSKSRQIRVDDIYKLEHFLHLSTGGEKRLAIIENCDRMNVQTQNAFLKSLEEPTKDSLIVMMTHNPTMLLSTIRSRCQSIALLDNRVAYEFEDRDRLFASLAQLKPQAGASAASVAAEGILGVMDELRSAAQADSKEHLRRLSAGNRDLEPAMRKQMEEEAAALLESQYRSRRAELLSAIHTWFAQEFMRANKIPAEILPNGEIYEGVNAGDAPEPNAARQSLTLADELIDTLNYNVDEKLAVENFCQQICRKSSR